MATNILIFISRKRSCDQNMKNHFPKIFVFLIILFKNVSQNKLCVVTLRNNANICLLPENGAADFNFFFTQRCESDSQAITKTEGEIFFARFNRRRKSKTLGLTGPPHALKC